MGGIDCHHFPASYLGLRLAYLSNTLGRKAPAPVANTLSVDGCSSPIGSDDGPLREIRSPLDVAVQRQPLDLLPDLCSSTI